MRRTDRRILRRDKFPRLKINDRFTRIGQSATERHVISADRAEVLAYLLNVNRYPRISVFDAKASLSRRFSFDRMDTLRNMITPAALKGNLELFVERQFVTLHHPVLKSS